MDTTDACMKLCSAAQARQGACSHSACRAAHSRQSQTPGCTASPPPRRLSAQTDSSPDWKQTPLSLQTCNFILLHPYLAPTRLRRRFSPVDSDTSDALSPASSSAYVLVSRLTP